MEEFNFSKEEMKQIKELLLERSKNESQKKEKEDIFNDKMAKLGFSNMKPKILSNVRVFKELKIPTIEAEIRIYKSEDDVLLDLLESNIRRRGEIGDSAKKVGKRIKELERLYGIQNGGDRGNQYKVAEPNNSALAKSQSDLATQMGISVDTLQNYKMLADMIAQNREKFMFSILETHD